LLGGGFAAAQQNSHFPLFLPLKWGKLAIHGDLLRYQTQAMG